MSVLNSSRKGKAGLKAAKVLGKRPGLVLAGAKAAAPAARLGLKASRPYLKKRTRQRVDQLTGAAEAAGELLTVQAPQVAYELGLAEPPKPKRTAPRLGIGIAIGAAGMYFLGTPGGRAQLQKLTGL